MHDADINRNASNPDQAFILAAGKGTRLRPHTDTRPKPMVEVAGRPLIDYALDRLEQAGVRHVTVNLHHMGDVLEAHLSGRPKPELTLSRETKLLDTGGGVKNALPAMKDAPFYLLNGDAFWSEGPEKNALDRLGDFFEPEDMDILLLLQPVETMVLTAGVGDYDIDRKGRARRRPGRSGAYMFTGIRIVHPRVFRDAPDGPFSFLELMDRSERQGRLYGLVHDGEWHHISTPQDLDRVNRL